MTSAFYELAETDAELQIVEKYRSEIDGIDEKIGERRRLIKELEELKGKRGMAQRRTELNAKIKSLDEW